MHRTLQSASVETTVFRLALVLVAAAAALALILLFIVGMAGYERNEGMCPNASTKQMRLLTLGDLS